MNSRYPRSRFRFRAGLSTLLASLLLPLTLLASAPAIGDQAPDFTLPALDGTSMKLSSLAEKGPVVLVVLRGWPGYQCPICDRQVQDFIAARDEFAAMGANLVFVYPGPADGLTAHAEEFKSWKGKQWPAEFTYLLDPDYTFTNAYGLRWDAPRETADPSTFIIVDGTIRFAQTSHSHGGRTKAADILAQLKSLTGKQ